MRTINYIVFDLEATCGPEIPNGESEIIEIGAVKYNDKLEKIGEFQSFIRPVLHPTITYFCEELTTIKQSDVDGADTFDIVFPKFYDWAIDIVRSGMHWKMEPTVFCSWGFYDKKMILADLAKWKHMTEAFADAIADNHISIKHQHGAMLAKEQLERHGESKRGKQLARGVGMEAALRMLGIPLEGTHHRGIDDARNIGKIFVELYPRLKFGS